ncbi:hypothetical protein ADIS_2547 [Lunatimonas lonarensis]|uniref:Uncharacterized protein n=1 Tax=Lunatimonas lonarensis TaxID=1232681 RepID=R7ZSL2_9BACT|nr:hypothetical protein ADIS_2547 [Lunatimonas lonarensis]
MSLPALPQKNMGTYSESIQDSLTDIQKEQVYKLFEKDFIAFGYGL